MFFQSREGNEANRVDTDTPFLLLRMMGYLC